MKTTLLFAPRSRVLQLCLIGLTLLNLFDSSTSNSISNSGSRRHTPDTSKECLPYALTQRSSDSFRDDIIGDIIVPSKSTKYINLKYMAKEKLLFCLIPKVASSYFIRLFSRIAGVPFKDRKAKKRLPLLREGVRDVAAPGSNSNAHTMESLRQGRYQALPSFDSGVSVCVDISVCACLCVRSDFL